MERREILIIKPEGLYWLGVDRQTFISAHFFTSVLYLANYLLNKIKTKLQKQLTDKIVYS